MVLLPIIIYVIYFQKGYEITNSNIKQKMKIIKNFKLMY